MVPILFSMVLLFGLPVFSHRRPARIRQIGTVFPSNQGLVSEEAPAQVVQVTQDGLGLFEDNPLWQTGLEEELIPDHYSGLSRAAYGLGVQIRETIEEAAERPPARIRIVEINLSKTDLSEFRRGLKTQYEQAEITFGPRQEGYPLDDMVVISLEKHEENDHPIHIRIDPSPNHSQRTSFLSGSVTGNLTATVESKKGSFFKTVIYDYRGWLWDSRAFLSHAGDYRWMVEMSDETATSREEARDQALGKAAEALSLHIRNANPALETVVAKEDLVQNDFIVDEYSQKLAGMAGPIWRYAVLLEVSPERLQSLAAEKMESARAERNSLLKQMVSLAGMLLLVCAAYIVANVATKGYYATVLAVTAVAAAAVLVFFILRFA